MLTTDSETDQGNHADGDYHSFLAKVNARFLKNTKAGTVPVFTTNAEGLFAAYLNALPAEQRQHHTCSACRHFIERYGALVTIAADGATESAVWDVQDAPELYAQSVAVMGHLARQAKVTGPFLSSDRTWGHPVTGLWHHLHIYSASVFQRSLLTAGQTMAEKREDFKNVLHALNEFPLPVVQQALKVLESEALYRTERVKGPAQWLHDVHVARAATTGSACANVLWRAIATAPAGYCHPRSSMIGTLLEDIAAGMDFNTISRRFAAKMDPASYQRSQAAPRAGQVEAAERAVAELGIAPAFARRYATAADFDTSGAVLWRPSEVVPAGAPAPAKAAGVFDHLKTAPAVLPELDIPPRVITMEKFQRDVLPGAAAIHYRAPLVGRFCALTAAADASAPPILQWDTEHARNTVSWAFPNPAARASDWNLQPGDLVPVRMIVSQPNEWPTTNELASENASALAHHGKGVFMLLEGAKDVRALPGGGLFAEHLRGDLKQYRSTIEAHMNRLTVIGAEAPETVGFGIGLLAGHAWTEAAAPVKKPGAPAGTAAKRIHAILVVDDSGSMQSYIGAARKAMRSLLDALGAMPGQLDVSFTLFGTRFTKLANCAPLHTLNSIEHNMGGFSGGTALNDAIIGAINEGMMMPDAAAEDTAFFFGIVTDGEEIDSRNSIHAVQHAVATAQNTGRWTIAYAGAGRNPKAYARQVGIPEGNIQAFSASERGFEEAGMAYANSTRSLASSYAAGARSSTSFFGAASSRQDIGKDHPVFVVTNKSGSRTAYSVDRWD